MFGLGFLSLIPSACCSPFCAGSRRGGNLGRVYLYGKHEGRQQATVARLEADVNAHIKREGIDHEVDSKRYRICLDLSGLLRGWTKPPKANEPAPWSSARKR